MKKFLALLFVLSVFAVFASDAGAQVVRSRTVVRNGFAPLFRPRVVVNNFGAVAVPSHVQFVQPQFVSPQVFVGQSFGVQSFGVQSFGVRSSFGCRGF